ncbi:MAG TPA: DoxX family membrane protein [Chthoniobacterales bacterium]|nr:DoxX family membrane protein [Chthoniobacterales bacterium]
MRMQFLGKYRELGLLIMRLGLGVLFILVTGPVLLAGPSGWASFGSAVRPLGLHSHYQIWGFLGALCGCLGGVLMIFGLFFRPAVLLVLLITCVHLLGALHGSLRANLAAVELVLMLVGMLFLGPGKYSVDKN